MFPTILFAFILPAFATAQTSPAAPSQMASMMQGQATKVLAIGRLTAAPSARLQSTMPDEVRQTVQLYLNGKIDQWYSRKDQGGVVFLMNVSTMDEAHALLEALPLGVTKQMEFQLIPLGPLNPLRFLLGTAEAGGPAK